MNNTGLPEGIDAIRHADASERQAMCDLMHLVFRISPTKPANHLFGPKHFHPQEWWLAEAAHTTVGCAGFLSRQTTTALLNIPWAVVLCVATHPDWRGRGIMSQVLCKGIADVDARGVPLSFLKGKRTRYTRFGWIEAGQRLGCTLCAPQFPAPHWPPTIVWHHVGTGEETNDAIELGQRLCAVQRSTQGITLRSELAQAAMVARVHIHTFYVEVDGQTAYAIVGEPQAIQLGWPPNARDHGNLAWIYELGGHPELIQDLVGTMLHDNEGPLHYLASPGLPPAERALWTKANSFGITTAGMIRIHHLGSLLATYQTWWESQPRMGQGALVLHLRCVPPEPDQYVRLSWTPTTVHVEPISAQRIHTGEIVVSGNRQEITLALFGPLDPVAVLPDEPNARFLRVLFPVPLDLPRLDQI